MTVVLTDADDGTAHELAIGETLEIQLESTPGAGYNWHQQNPDPRFPESSRDWRTAFPGLQTGTLHIFFVGIAGGTFVLDYRYYRDWEGVETATDFFLVTIRVVSMNLHHVRKNFVYHLEQITPTYTGISRKFKAVDRIRLGANEEDADNFGNTSGRARDFIVRRLACPDIDEEPTRGSMREARHIYQVIFAYPTAIGLEADVHEMMDSDRHDVIKRLRTDTYFVGVEGDAAQATGLLLRERLSDELDDSGKVWLQTFEFECLIREEEF